GANHQRQDAVDVTAPDREAGAPGRARRAVRLSLAQGTLDVGRGVAQVHVGGAVQGPPDVPLEGDVDRAARVPPVTDAETTRVEIDLLDQVGGEDRGAGQEVVEDRDRLAADE